MEWTTKGNLNVVNQTVSQPTTSNQEKVYSAVSQQLLIIKYISTFQCSKVIFLLGWPARLGCQHMGENCTHFFLTKTFFSLVYFLIFGLLTIFVYLGCVVLESSVHGCPAASQGTEFLILWWRWGSCGVAAVHSRSCSDLDSGCSWLSTNTQTLGAFLGQPG